MASDGTINLKIGENNLTFKSETKKAIDTEILLLHIPLLLIIIAYGLNFLTWPLFFLLFYVIAMRVFIGNHDRYHSNTNVRLPRFLEIFAEGLGVIVTPWDEPYDSIKRKHLIHHATHKTGEIPIYDTKKDPNCAYEMGGLFNVLLSCLFYEEVQLYFDIRDKNLTRSRLFRFLIYVPMQIGFILFFGINIFLGVFIATRLIGFTAWFVFSWIIHQPFIYKFGFSRDVPKWFKFIFQILHGKRVSEGCIHHATHHKWPAIPSGKLYKFDSIVMENPI